MGSFAVETGSPFRQIALDASLSEREPQMTMLRQIRLARATLIGFAAMGVMWGAYAALIPDMIRVLSVNDATFGSLIIATPLAAVVTMLVAPKIAPRFGRHVLPLAILALALAFMIPGWQGRPLQFALAMVVVGVTNGFLDVTMTARVSTIEADQGLHLMNLNHAAYSFAYAGASVLTGWARTAGWGPGPVLSGLALMVAGLSLLATERGAGVNGFAREVGAKGRMGQVPLWGGLIVLIAFMSENAAENWSALHIERTLGAARGVGSFGPAVLALTMGFGRICGQVVIARLDEARLMRWGAIIAAGGLVLVGLAPTPLVAYLGLIVTGLGGSVLVPTAFAAVGRLAAPELRAQVIARTTALGYFGYFFGPPALGFLSQLLGLRAALVAMAGIVLLVLVLFPRLLRAGGGRKTGQGGTTVNP